MQYLFLSFSKHLNEDSKSSFEFYNESLKKQYEKLKIRIPLERRISSFQEFIENCFQTGLEKRYYISCPNFLREKKQLKENSPEYLSNVVIRPYYSEMIQQCLPDGQNVILIGDIYEGNKLKMFEVKGIQFIDSSMFSSHDLVIDAACCNSFGKDENKRELWSIRGVEYTRTYFTPDNINQIIQNCYTVANPFQVRQTYNNWKRYIDFRKYYLDEQSKRNFKLDGAFFCDSYAINKKDYRKDTLTYDECLLDERQEFKSNSDMIVLSKQIGDSVPFPLIKVYIDRNKKEFESNIIIQNDKKINEEEKKIRSLANDNVFITPFEQNEENYGYVLKNGYELGERFKILKSEILPTEHIEQLNNQCTNAIVQSDKGIDTKFKLKIENELKQIIDKFSSELGTEAIGIVNEYRQSLDRNLEQEILDNKDEKINKIIKSEIEKIKKDNEKYKNESDYELRIKSVISKIDIKSYYIERNRILVEEYAKKQENEIKNKIAKYKHQKEIELNNKYKEDITKEKIELKTQITLKYEELKSKAIDEETILRFAIYFKPKDTILEIKKKDIDIINSCKYIIYDNRAEKAKISRQDKALENFYSGNVKNPYLSTYLFSPTELTPIDYNYENWNWYLSTLNEKQQDAVKRAVASNGIFLLQGPPGTGKTQVIAETVAHLVKKGKKVLISSETHKAIDNVFERLPKIADIVPIRLIPSQSKKDSEYSPSNLVYNFYNNISTNMVNAINKFNNFKQNKESFIEEYKKLELLKSKLQKNQSVLQNAENKINSLEIKAKEYNNQISELKDYIEKLQIDKDKLNRTKRHIEKNNLNINDDDIDKNEIIQYVGQLQKLLNIDIFLYNSLEDTIKNISNITSEEIENELILLNPNSQSINLEIKKSEIKSKMANCKDELDEFLPGKEQEYKDLQSQLRELINSSKNIEITPNLKLKTFINFNCLPTKFNELKNIIIETKNSINTTKNNLYVVLDNAIDKIQAKIQEFNSKINSINLQKRDVQQDINDIREQADIQEIQKQKYELESGIDKFFKDFSIETSYIDVDNALEIIKSTWKDLNDNYEKREKENKEKIPMYEKISTYLSKEDVVETDKRDLTKELFQNANVFGITCTSNDRFSGANNNELSEFGIDGVDLKTVGIDVVIIDEVSKSSFIDLLIPILYGKTVILVGDHRQLPPMYEFSKLRDDDFEGLNNDIINKQINKQFTQMYEECFFKTLFEKTPDDYKIMLTKQYRCHGDIMNVFNHFYQNQLEIGEEGQNNKKRHNITLISGGRRIIEPDKHIYFVDCKKFETRDSDSTSIYNENEARIVCEMIKKLNEYFTVNKQLERLSIGVICTYGDQAKKIKEILKQEKIKTDAFKTDEEKMIVSTVDDFQGDERDIIILTTVRNPEEPAKSNAGFILAYQRINVALSRARRLLIMVGNKKYLMDKGVIDLPDVFGREEYDKKNFRVYDKIIDTIETNGKIISDIEIFDEKGENNE